MFDDNVDARLSRLETLVANISNVLEKLQSKLESQSKINWAPIAIFVTVFFTVAGAVSTVYNARISTINSAVEGLARHTTELEKSNVEQRLRIQSHGESVNRLQNDVERLETRFQEHERSFH